MRYVISFIMLMAAWLQLSAQWVRLSQPHGFYDTAFTLDMTAEEAYRLRNYTIRYTTDGREPTAESKVFTAPMTISSNAIIRAAVVTAEGKVCDISTATYLFADDVMRQPDYPQGYPTEWGSYCQIFGTAIADYGMDPELTQDWLLTEKIRNGLTAIPTLSIVTDKDNFFSHENDSVTGGIYIYTGTPVGDGTGRDWVRPVSMELFGGSQDYDITADCGVKIHGGHSRLPEKTPKHSLRLMFKKEYGEAKLNYPLWGEDGPETFDQLILRSMFGNTWEHWDSGNRKSAQYTRDLWARSIQRLMGHPSSRGLYVHLYINGLYWGLYNIAERIDNDYCNANFGGKKEQYDVIKVDEDHASHRIVAGDGNLDAWQRMMRLVSDASSSNKAYQQLIGCDDDGNPDSEGEKLLDIDNFIDFMLINEYGGNTDWDHHNWLAFKNRERANEGFRFICWDTELIFGSLSTNNLDYDNSGSPTHILQKLMKNQNFRHRYIDRAYRHLVAEGGWLTPEKVVEVWDSLYHVIELPLYDESARWGDYRRDVHPYSSSCREVYTVDNQYMTERKRLTGTYFPQRTTTLLRQMLEKGWYPDLDVPEIRLNSELIGDSCPVLSVGDRLTFKSSNIVYYTLDGTNPATWMRTTTGSPTSTAERYSGKNILDNFAWNSAKSITVKAICKNGNIWSPVIERTFHIDYHDPGDVNIDGDVDISDIVATINTIAGDETFKSTADVNGDGSVDISDVVAVINIIAGQE